MNESLKFKKNESFYLREGWIEKAINAINENHVKNIFAQNNGTEILGIGSNMVKGLRYWLQSAKIITSNSHETKLTNFGELLLKYDRYIETNFSLFFIHYFLVKSIKDNPIANIVFNTNILSFTKQDIFAKIIDFLEQNEYKYNTKYVEDDLSIFLKSYYQENVVENPEDNYSCPLSELKLLSKKGDKYNKLRPHYNTLNYLLVYFSLSELYEYNTFNIEESTEDKNSPYYIFNLDKNLYLQYLDEIKNNGLITINKTAGLNIVYFEKKLKIDEIFENYFGGKKNVQ